jgi:hypothetical protein
MFLLVIPIYHEQIKNCWFFIWNHFIAYRKDSLRSNLPLLMEAYQVGLEVGDV